MVQLDPGFEPHRIEEEAISVWKARRLPPSGGTLGSREGPMVLQFEGSFTAGEPEGPIAQRAVAADVDARYLALSGRSALGTLRDEASAKGETAPQVGPTLRRLGVWTGGDGSVPWDNAERHARAETLFGRLAHRGVVVSRDLPLRACPTCGEPRSPERIIYQEEEGDTYLVRFDVPHGERTVHALVWVDAPWRLLGTSALLVHPELPYVIARYRRKEAEELVLTSKSSIDRFRSWLPGGTLEVLEEHPGRFFDGRTYDYPLRHEFPTGGALAPPGGTIVAVTDVTDTGTGIVPLVPGHGSTDAAIAESHGVTGWPLVTPRGQLDLTLMHKYAGLDLPTGNEFIVRDLIESDAVFAHLRVRRGVPYCAICGTPLLWIPGRAWCLEPARLPPDRLEMYSRLLPRALPLGRLEVVPWALSGATRSDDPAALALLECPRCERLEALGGPVACPCGGRRYPVRRRLLPSAAGALVAWSRLDPFPLADSIRLYVGERRRVPVVVHHLMAMSGLEGSVGDVGLTLLPTLSDAVLPELIEAYGADAVRVAFVRAGAAERPPGTFSDHCRVERDRLARLWTTSLEVLAMCDAGMLASFSKSVGDFLGELETEDRAIVARWERTRVLALADYDRWDPASVHRRLVRFLESDLAEYRSWIRARLAPTGTSSTKRSALRTLTHILRNVAMLLGPIAPHTAEAIYRRLASSRTSLFEGTLPPVDRTLLNDDLYGAWNRWRSVLRAVSDFRRECGISPDGIVPSAALLVGQDDVGDKLRSDRPVLERIGRIGRLEVGSPREPWQGRQRQVRPIESEVQRFYPSQATQIIHLLGRTPPRKLEGNGTGAELSVVIQGFPVRIFPSMVEYVETLPAGMLPRPWTMGEMYLELPSGAKSPLRAAPPLSPDAFWLVRRLERALRRSGPPPEGQPRVAIISTSDPLASELRKECDAIAKYLGIAEVRVPEALEESPPPRRLKGRTRTGVSWWVHVPGMNVASPRAKHRPPTGRSRRIPLPAASTKPAEVDYTADEAVNRWQAVRALGTELDSLIGAPLLGPSKVSRAWDQGLTSVDAYRRASFETLVALPGFGRAVASVLVQKLGGSVPPAHAGPPPHRLRTERTTPMVEVRPAGTPEPVIPTPPLSREIVPLPPVPPMQVLGPAAPPSPPKPVEMPPATPAAKSESEPAAAPSQPAPESVPEESRPISEPSGVASPTPEPETAGPEEAAPEVGTPPAESATVLPVSGDVAAEPEPGESAISEASSAPVESTELPATREPVAEELPTPATSLSEQVGEEAAVPVVVPVTEPEPLGEIASIEPVAPVSPPSAAESAEARPEISGTESAGAEVPVPLLSETPPETGEPPPTASGETQPEPEVTAEPTVEPAPPPLGEGVTLAPASESAVAPGPEAPVTETPPPEPLPEAALAEPVPSEELTREPERTEEVPSAEPVVEPTPAEEAPVTSAAVEAPTPTAAEVEARPAEMPPVGEITPVMPVVTEVPAVPELEEAPPEAAAREMPVPPAPTVPEPAVEIPKPPPSGVELEMGSSPLSSIQPFLDATAAGHRGVCIVRESPERVSAQVGPRPVDVYWLTNLGRGKTLRPNDLPGIFTFLARALGEERISVFFLEGIEYLIRIHGVDTVVARLAEFDRQAKAQDARVWVHLNAALLRADDLEKVVAALGPGTRSE